MKRIFSYTQKKFLSFPKKKQHKKCAELLQSFAINQEPAILQEYEKAASWMDLTSSFKPGFNLEERFHYHLAQAEIVLAEHNFLRQLRTKDREEASSWLSVHTYLDGLRSSHNVGSIVRTIEAFRLGPLHLSNDMMEADHRSIQKVSMGAWKEVSIEHGTALPSLPHPWIALETMDRALSWDTFIYPENCTLILGNEERGISPSLLSVCDQVVTIPLFGKKNSLNVANAFAILAAKLATQVRSRTTKED